MSDRAGRRPLRRARPARIQLTTSSEVKEKIRLAASLEGVSISAFVLRHAYETAQQVI